MNRRPSRGGADGLRRRSRAHVSSGRPSLDRDPRLEGVERLCRGPCVDRCGASGQRAGDRRRHRGPRPSAGCGGWALVCVAVGAVGFAVSASLGWSTASDDAPADWLLRAAGSLTVWSLALAQVAILLLAQRSRRRKLVDRSIGTAVAGALALAALLTVAIVDKITDEDFYRWVGVTAVVWVLGIALVPIARKLQREPR